MGCAGSSARCARIRSSRPAAWRIARSGIAAPRARRDQAADDHVLLQALERVDLAVDGRSVSTRVVSWNEAAEMNGLVCSRPW